MDEPRLTPWRPIPWRHWRWALLLVLLAPLAAQLPGWLAGASCNPLYRAPGLVAQMPRTLLPGGCTLDANDGSTLQAFGGAAAESWLRGHLPWWNPYAGIGMPLAAEAQPAAFFLPFVLLLHAIWGVVALKILMQMLAGAASLALFRELGAGRFAATVGATLFALNGTFAFYTHSMMLPVAFLPSLIFGIERCRTLALRSSRGGQVWVALALAYSLLAGFPETAFMDGLLAALWGLVALARTPANRRLALAAKVAAGGAAGLALSAPAWVSFLDYLRIGSIGVHAGVATNHLVPGMSALLLMPTIFALPYANWALPAWTDVGGYFGPSLAFLALMGMVSGPRLALLRRALLGWVAFWLCAFFGELLAHALWAALPPLNLVQITRYGMPALEFAATTLAVLALDDWRRAPAGLRPGPAAASLALLGVIALEAAINSGLLPRVSPNLLANLGNGFVLACACAVIEALAITAALALLLRRPASHTRALLLAILVAADALVGFAPPELAGTRPNQLALGPMKFLRAHAGLNRVVVVADALPLNQASRFEFAAINADSLPFPLDWGAAAAEIGANVNQSALGWVAQPPAAQIADIMAHLDGLRNAAVRYLVLPAADDPFLARPDGALTPIYQNPHTRIYEIAGAAPYFETIAGACTLDVISRLHVKTDCNGPARLLRRELMLEGWRATANGTEAKLAKGHGYFQEIMLPAGKADVRFAYAPPHAWLMAELCAAGAAGSIAMVAFAATANRRHRGT